MQLVQIPLTNYGLNFDGPCDFLESFAIGSISDTSSEKSDQEAPISTTMLHNLFAKEIPIQQASSDVIKIDDAEILNSLLTAFSILKPDVNEVAFHFEEKKYLLSQEQGDSSVLILKNSEGEQVTKLEKTSLEKMHSRVILLNLFSRVGPKAKEKFSDLFDIEKIAHVTNHSPIVSGDLDGSTARQIVLGIQTGTIHVDSEGIALLAEVINAEADLLNKINNSVSGYFDSYTAGEIVTEIQSAVTELTRMQVSIPLAIVETLQMKTDAASKLELLREWIVPLLFARFQTNKTIQRKMEALAEHLTYQEGHTQFISIGDGAHDRFSNNKDIDREIRERMHAQGAIFITGNHDVFFTKDFKDINEEDKMNFSSSFGAFAKDTASDSEWEAHQKKVLSNAYYDEAANTLYLHHGFGVGESTGSKLEILSVFGDFSVEVNGSKFDLVRLTKAINSQSLPRPDSVFQKDEEEARIQNNFEFNEFTGFRPEDDVMMIVAMVLGVRIVHGHNANKNTFSENVIGLNSRVGNRLAVVAAHVGEKMDSAPFWEAEMRAPKRKFSLIADESLDEDHVCKK